VENHPKKEFRAQLLPKMPHLKKAIPTFTKFSLKIFIFERNVKRGKFGKELSKSIYILIIMEV
jgi:hypothetical protein